MELLRRWRLRQHARLLRRFPLAPTPTAPTIAPICEIWSRVRVKEYSTLPLHLRHRQLHTYSDNLPQLIKALGRQNRLIEQEHESLLHTLLKNRGETSPRVLDLYLTEEGDLPIDVPTVLEEFQVILNLHHQGVRGEDGEFYQRVSFHLYHDVVEFTNALLTEQEAYM